MGTWIISNKNANLLRVNQIYLFSCGLFIVYFWILGMWVNVVLYIGLGGFAIRGWIHHRSLPIEEDWETKRKRILHTPMH
jgi:hypothetical protein